MNENELEGIIGRLLAILVLLYAMLFMIGGPKLANRNAKSFAKDAGYAILLIIMLPIFLLKHFFKKRKGKKTDA